MTPTQKRIAGIFALAFFLYSSAWAIGRLRSPADDSPPFERVQWVTAEIVTAPTHTTHEGLVYDEKSVTIHSSHRFPIATSGEGQSITAMDGKIPVQFVYSSARASDDGPSIVLTDLEIYLPIEFRINDHEKLRWLSYFSSDTTISTDPHDFQRRVGIHYRGENLPNTFLRMRIDVRPQADPVIDLASD